MRPLTPAFAAAVQAACDRTGALLICDEVQCGLGRTGHPFFYPVLGLRPHLVAIGKALGAGIPIGAALVAEDVARRIDFGDHGSTYGGNLLACRAGLYFVEPAARRRAAGSRRAGRCAPRSTPPRPRAHARHRARGARPRPDARPRSRSACRAGRGRRACARAARQRDRANRRAHAAAADDHRNRKSIRPSTGSMPRWPRSLERHDDVCHRPAHAVRRPTPPCIVAAVRTPVELREAAAGDVDADLPADCGSRRLRPPAAAHARGDRKPHRAVRRRRRRRRSGRLRRARAAERSRRGGSVARGRRARPWHGRRAPDPRRARAARGHATDTSGCARSHTVPPISSGSGSRSSRTSGCREKVFTDCVGCPLFRTCGQHAVVLALDERQMRQTSMRLANGIGERVA